LGFKAPTNVQEEAIPKVLVKKDLIVMAKTGSGKTGAFGIPVLQSVEHTSKLPQALILTPTRELAVQVDKDLKTFSKHINLKSTAVYGQHNITGEIEVFERGVSIVSGTPGRVFDHIQRKTLKTNEIKFLILDEADRMLDMGFIDQVVKIIKALPKDRVTLLFSATMPDEIQKICRAYMKDPEVIALDSDTKTVDSITQVYYRVERNEKRTQLDRILMAKKPDSCIIFCNTRNEVDKVQTFLDRKGYVSGSLHGANSQSSRMRTIERFQKGKLQMIVATDVAARGIHIDDLSLVINYDVPVEKDSYVHRIGRTGRAGNGGHAITFVTANDIMTLYEIEEHVGAMIEEKELPSDELVAKERAIGNGKWDEIKKSTTRPVVAHVKKEKLNKEHVSSELHAKVKERKTSITKKHSENIHTPREHKTVKPLADNVKTPRENSNKTSSIKASSVKKNVVSTSNLSEAEKTKLLIANARKTKAVKTEKKSLLGRIAAIFKK
jgi:superfamily II DNA/RNA helicase